MVFDDPLVEYKSSGGIVMDDPLYLDIGGVVPFEYGGPDLGYDFGYNQLGLSQDQVRFIQENYGGDNVGGSGASGSPVGDPVGVLPPEDTAGDSDVEPDTTSGDPIYEVKTTGFRYQDGKAPIIGYEPEPEPEPVPEPEPEPEPAPVPAPEPPPPNPGDPNRGGPGGPRRGGPEIDPVFPHKTAPPPKYSPIVGENYIPTIGLDPSYSVYAGNPRVNLGVDVAMFDEGGKVEESIVDKAARQLGVASDDLAWAMSQDQKYPLAERVDGKGDAARHLALGYLTSQANYPDLALLGANLREYFTSPLNSASRDMDLFNNKLGASIQAGDREEAVKIIDEMIKSGKAKYMTKQESDDAYEEAYGR